MRTTPELCPFPQKDSPLWSRVWFISLVALSIRLAVVPFLVGDQLNPARDHWVFGWETGRLARSLATGHGFGSPLFGLTGPSAWMGPVYPGLLALVFKIFGVYSKASAYAILCLNCFFAALTCLPLHAIARSVLNNRTATITIWVWALYPYSFDFAAGQVWSTALNALLLTLAIASTIALERRYDPLWWLAWGLLWGLIGLAEPSLLACLPITGIWLAIRLRHRGIPWIFFWRTAFAALAFLCVVTPWLVRNERALGRFVPFRTNFWLTFYQGNTSDTTDLYPDWANPPHNDAEMAEYARVGELAYMDEKKVQALAEVREHPARFAWVTLRRIVFTWTGYWSLGPAYRSIEPFAVPNLLITTLFTALAARGFVFLWGSAPRFALLFAFLFLAYPAVYYITHPSMAYRHPIDPLLLVLCVAAFTMRKTKVELSAPRVETELATATR